MPRPYAVPALEKAIDIVELLARAPDPLGLSAIAGALGRSPGEIFRVLRTLERRGYLARDGADRYLLTNRLFLHGLRRPTTAALLELAYPEMRRLAAEIGQSCHISLPTGDHMVTVARVEDARSASFVVPIGFSVPLLDSASGRVFLAFLPPAEQAAPLARLRGAARLALAARLARIRRRGYELAPSNSVAGITDLSFPLFEADARPAAFLAVPLTQRRDGGRSRAAVIERVRRAASRIDHELASLRRPGALAPEVAE